MSKHINESERCPGSFQRGAFVAAPSPDGKRRLHCPWCSRAVGSRNGKWVMQVHRKPVEEVQVQVRPGDMVHFRRADGLVALDTVRTLFVQHDTLGNSYRAVTLTEHSWCAVADIVRVESTHKGG